MIEIDGSSHGPHIFWLFAWGRAPLSTSFYFGPQYSRCEISQEELIIYDKSIDFRIPIKEIQICELYDKPWTGAASGVNFRIKFSSGDVGKSQHKQTEEVYLCPSHVFKHRDDVDEMKAMLMVIESYRTGNVASIQKNPYHRQLIRQGQSERIAEREWKPHLPPSHYSTAPSLKRFLTIAPLVFIAVMLTILITTAVIFYLVTEVF